MERIRYFISKSSTTIQKASGGFTLVEILLVIAVVSIVTSVGANTYNDYANAKRISTAADEVANALNVAKSRAISQVKPAACGSAELDGYRLVVCPGGCTGGNYRYQVETYCGGNGVRVGPIYSLPANVTFSSTSQQTVLFRTITGAAESSNDIILNSSGKTRRVSTTKAGVIAMIDPGAPLPTSTPIPGTAPTPTTAPPAPTVNLSANPTTITLGNSSTLSWSSTNAVTCTATDGWSGAKATTGTQSVSPATTTTYSIYCQSSAGVYSSVKSVDITVNPGPTASLTADPNPIVAGGSTTLQWSSTNATGCTASGGWTGAKATSGTQSVSPAATTGYSIYCTSSDGTNSSTQTVTVTVNQPTPTPTIAGTVYMPFSTTGLTSDTAGNVWKNSNFRVLDSGGAIINQVGFYGSAGSGANWEARVSNSAGITDGTLIASGTLGTVAESGFYTQATNFTLAYNAYAVFRVFQSTGTTSYYKASSAPSPFSYNKYNIGSGTLWPTGSYEYRFIYQ
ncbi:MAG: prepilin-type N-terminal cleavage/methylation domain-containing protein [Candidatus Levybacteria bacterium]|nr:prepilin-type N-terminal cleavage/methylation domain-containing protein [Candidatus Levybacteria bacterium]